VPLQYVSTQLPLPKKKTANAAATAKHASNTTKQKTNYHSAADKKQFTTENTKTA
jgi:hypothetical protein